MRALYEGVADILKNDTDLKALVEYTQEKKNIRRAYMPTGQWDKFVVFYFQPETIIDEVTSKIRVAPLIVRVFDRKSDMVVDDMAERIILLLDGCDLTVTGKVHCYDSSYMGELLPSNYNEDLKAYEKILRFEVRYRVDVITGSTGIPTKRRMRDWNEYT